MVKMSLIKTKYVRCQRSYSIIGQYNIKKRSEWDEAGISNRGKGKGIMGDRRLDQMKAIYASEQGERDVKGKKLGIS